MDKYMNECFNGFFMNVELVDEDSKMPQRANSTDAGMDMFARKTMTLQPHRRYLVPLGVKVEFSDGYVLRLEDKSGRAWKDGLHTFAGTVDSEYRGEIGWVVYNAGDKPIKIEKGQKVVQGTVYPIWTGQPKQVGSVDINTDRGEGGFGSTSLY